jgi:two-component system, sporulation sensor kinase E
VCENKQWDQKRLVEVKSYRSASDESKIMIDVIDSGMGVSNEDRDKLFKSQFTTKSNEQGTGLGLSISRRFIRAFSGDLYLAESKPCQRTIFRIELPLLQKINTTEAAA